MWYAILITVLVGYLLGNLNGAVCMSRWWPMRMSAATAAAMRV